MVGQLLGNGTPGLCMGSIALFLALFGLLLIIQYLQAKRAHKTSDTWQTIEGKITLRRIREEENYDEDGANIVFYPEVIYTYQVADTLYENNRIDFSAVPSFVNRNKAEAFLEPYQLEGKVTVYCNPDNPQDAVLTKSVSRMKGRLFTGLVFLAIAAYLIIRVLTQ